MKKKLLLFYIIFILSIGYSLNFDYGASVDSFVGANISDPSYVFGFEKVSIYSSVQVSNSLSFAIDGFYKFSYNSSSSEDNSNTFDFSTLIATLPIGRSSLQVGRSIIRDYSGDILSHTLDGVSISVPLGFATLIGNIGYLGLVNRNEVTFIKTAQDDDGISRIIEGVDLVKEMETLALWASVYSQQDTNSMDNNLSIYGGGGVSGSVGSDIYYSVRGNYQAGLFPYQDSVTDKLKGAGLSAGMGAVTLNWYINSDSELIRSLSPYLTVDFGISSGDSNLGEGAVLGASQSKEVSDGITLYSPMVSGGPGVIYSTNNQNLTYFKVLASASPIKNLQTQLGTTVFFRTVKGAMSDTDVANDADGSYLGSEVSLTANYRPYSDLGVSVSGGVFFPDGTVLDKSASGMITVYLSLSL